MKRFLAVALILAALVTAAAAQTPGSPVNLAFATLDTGSAWYVYGATMAELLRKSLPGGLEHRRQAARRRGGQPAAGRQERDARSGSASRSPTAGPPRARRPTRKSSTTSARSSAASTRTIWSPCHQEARGSPPSRDPGQEDARQVYTQPVGALGEFAGRQLLRATGFGYNDIKGWGGTTPTSATTSSSTLSRTAAPTSCSR